MSVVLIFMIVSLVAQITMHVYQIYEFWVYFTHKNCPRDIYGFLVQVIQVILVVLCLAGIAWYVTLMINLQSSSTING